MSVSYYQHPSPLGEPIIDLLNIDTSIDCITAIEWGEIIHNFKYSECQIVRYLWRLGLKTEDMTHDCHAILWYTDRAIANESAITETLKILKMEVTCLMLKNRIEIPNQ